MLSNGDDVGIDVLSVNRGWWKWALKKSVDVSKEYSYKLLRTNVQVYCRLRQRAMRPSARVFVGLANTNVNSCNNQSVFIYFILFYFFVCLLSSPFVVGKIKMDTFFFFFNTENQDEHFVMPILWWKMHHDLLWLKSYWAVR